jgi:hypothetical protein
MLDFTPVREKHITLGDLAAGMTRANLRGLTNEMIDIQLKLIEECTDADDSFVPYDPQADDPFAATPEEVTLAWTLGHVIVHVTASSEEAGAIAQELARGVEFHGRSRSEIPWQSVTTIEHCRQRLEESRRMRLASLEMWPNQPHLDNEYQSRPTSPRMNAISRYLYGLMHDDDHLGQMAEIISQAQRARAATQPQT